MTPLVIGIDPGTKQSAYVAWDGQWIQEIGTEPNPQVAKYLRDVARRTGRETCVVFEAVEPYGMVVGREVFETIFWTGRLFQIARDTIGPKQVSRLPRRAVKKFLKLTGYAFVFSGSFGPLDRATLEFLQHWYTSQQFVTFTESEPSLEFSDEVSEDDEDDEPFANRTPPMFDDAEEPSPGVDAAKKASTDRRREKAHHYPKKKAKAAKRGKNRK